ncbi:MAG: hypothetical protein PVG82_03540 [Chromatiales bacterium]|jgi:hypothetical protein
MADLQQILGAVLRDLAKARFGADLYSRSISRYYENDYLLRRFPVPRADVEEVELDLKFSIAEIQDSEVNHESQEANSAVLFERAVERLVSTFLNIAGAREQADPKLRERRTQYVSKGYGSTVLRIEMRQKLLRYFIESFTHFIDDDGNFNVDLAMADLERPFRWAMEQYAHDAYREDPEAIGEMKGALREMIQPVVDDPEVKKAMAAMGPPLKAIWQGNSDARLEILIEGSQLAQLSEAAISSIKLKAVVRNMIWTEVKVDKYTTRHALTPE